MADDWRVTVTLHDGGQARRAVRALRGHELQGDVRRRLGHGVAVSADSSRIFLYAGTADAAREAERVVREVLGEQQLPADLTLDRWDALNQEWADPGTPAPDDAEARQAEHQRLIDEETRQSLMHGEAGWEVRADMPSHHEAVALAERLRADGHPVIRRWKYLILGASNEDQATELAQTIQRETSPAASLRIQPAQFSHYGPGQTGEVFFPAL
jgi:hypothetical protein